MRGFADESKGGDWCFKKIVRRGGQVVRRGTANPLRASSILAPASIKFFDNFLGVGAGKLLCLRRESKAGICRVKRGNEAGSRVLSE